MVEENVTSHRKIGLRYLQALQDEHVPPALSEPAGELSLEALKLSAEDHLVDRGTLSRLAASVWPHELRATHDMVMQYGMRCAACSPRMGPARSM